MVNDEVIRAIEVSDFRSFYLAEFAPLVALAASVSGDPGDAEDIAQEALRRANDRWSRLAGYDDPVTWVRRVVINLSLNRRRSLGRRAAAMLRLGSPPPQMLPDEVDDGLWRAVAELPGNQRAAVALHYLEDRPVAEIAIILGCSESTARVHLHRARRHLHERLRDQGGPHEA